MTRDIFAPPPQDIGEQTVPDALMGCWRRNWIRFAGAERQDYVRVIWLQTASGMGDLRIDPNQTPDQTNSSCGITIVEETTKPLMTADWFDGDTGFTQQQVPSFPEAGWLRWDSDSIMHELAPSGAYEEQWQKLPDSNGTVHYVALNAAARTNLYIAGSHYLLAVERSDAETVHEYSYGVRLGDTDTVTVSLSTRHERVAKTMELDFDWQLISSRKPR